MNRQTDGESGNEGAKNHRHRIFAKKQLGPFSTRSPANLLPATRRRLQDAGRAAAAFSRRRLLLGAERLVIHKIVFDRIHHQMIRNCHDDRAGRISRREPVYRPRTTRLQRVTKSIVQTVRASLPKLHPVGFETKSTPLRREWNLSFSETLFQLSPRFGSDAPLPSNTSPAPLLDFSQAAGLCRWNNS